MHNHTPQLLAGEARALRALPAAFAALIVATGAAGSHAQDQPNTPMTIVQAPAKTARNLIAVIRVSDTYYMSSTTMHMSPGLPICPS